MTFWKQVANQKPNVYYATDDAPIGLLPSLYDRKILKHLDWDFPVFLTYVTGFSPDPLCNGNSLGRLAGYLSWSP
jgi:hypothetical protein